MGDVDQDRFATFRDVDSPLTGLTLDLVVYLDHPLSRYRDAVMEILDRFYDLIPRAQLCWFRTETMTRDKESSARTFAMPAQWWRSGARRKPLRYLQIHDGAAYNAVPRAGVRIQCTEFDEDESEGRPWDPSALRLMVPVSFAEGRREELVGLMRLIVERLPVVSGHGGYCIERNQDYYDVASMQAAYALAMRYQGVDIDYRLSDEEFDHLKTVNWLTVVGKRLVVRAGGKQELMRRLAGKATMYEAHGTVVIRACEGPKLGDVNAGGGPPKEYVAVYRAVQCLFAPAFTPPFKLRSGEDEAKTEAWYRRFAQEDMDAN